MIAERPTGTDKPLTTRLVLTNRVNGGIPT